MEPDQFPDDRRGDHVEDLVGEGPAERAERELERVGRDRGREREPDAILWQHTPCTHSKTEG
jgi:hypothetical protein